MILVLLNAATATFESLLSITTRCFSNATVYSTPSFNETQTTDQFYQFLYTNTAVACGGVV